VTDEILPPAGHTFTVPGPNTSEWVRENCLIVTKEWVAEREAEIEALKVLLSMTGYEYRGSSSSDRT